LEAILLYNKNPGNDFNGLLNVILGCLKPENWNKEKKEFDYDRCIEKAQKLPDNYKQKKRIIETLENYKKKEEEINLNK